MLTTINYLAFWGMSHDPTKIEEHPFWISLNEFCTRLTKVNICDESKNAINLCNSLLEDYKLDKNSTDYDYILSDITEKIRKHPNLIAIILSAAAQYIIHAALNVYTFCERCRTLSCD